MTNYETDPSQLGKSVRGLDQNKRGELEDKLSPKLVKDLERENLENPDPKIIYTVGEVGRIRTEELGLTYPELKINDRFKIWRTLFKEIYQKEIADECDVSQQVISKIENNGGSLRPKTAKKILEGTNLSKEYLGLPEFVYDEDDLSEGVLEILTGGLLGDGSIEKREHKNNRFVLNGRDQRYVGYIQQEFGEEGIYGNINITDRDNSKISIFQSKALSLFNDDQILRKFYEYDPDHPSSGSLDFRKKITEEMELTPRVMKIWYMGHGSLAKRKGFNPFVNLSTRIYPREEVEILQEKLSQRFKMHRICKSKKYKGEDRGYIIGVSAGSTPALFDWMCDCPKLARNAVTDEGKGTRMRDKWL